MNYSIYATKAAPGGSARFYINTAFDTGSAEPFIFNSSNRLGDGLGPTQTLRIGINDSVVTPAGATTMTTSLVAIDSNVIASYDVGGKLVVQVSSASVA